MDLDMLSQTFTEPIISSNSRIVRKKLKSGLTIGLEPEQLLSKLKWLGTGLADSDLEVLLLWEPPLCLWFICGQKENSSIRERVWNGFAVIIFKFEFEFQALIPVVSD